MCNLYPTRMVRAQAYNEGRWKLLLAARKIMINSSVSSPVLAKSSSLFIRGSRSSGGPFVRARISNYNMDWNTQTGLDVRTKSQLEKSPVWGSAFFNFSPLTVFS